LKSQISDNRDQDYAEHVPLAARKVTRVADCPLSAGERIVRHRNYLRSWSPSNVTEAIVPLTPSEFHAFLRSSS
jgi:hypothetical protein